jgi:predicted transcriptional regulator
MKKVATLECPTCQGKGEVPLPENLAVILPILRSRPDATVEEVRIRISDEITVNGVNNRLTRLFDLGLVTRRRVGKFFHYSLAK